MDSRFVNINTSISQDGLGIPVISIYFSYCDKKDITGVFCPNCQNYEFQKDGIGFNLKFDTIVGLANKKLSQMENMIGREVGICFLGGEPLAEINRGMFMKLSKYYQDKFQIIYTWREKEKIDKEWIKYIDKLVCGEYKEELKDDNYILGSTNQYIMDFDKKIILKYEKEVV